jgi:phospholipid/cholesterol/gamma-HCH transport system permease protein
MTAHCSQTQIILCQNTQTYFCQGIWTTLNVAQLCNHIKTIEWSDKNIYALSGKKLQMLDSAGAIILIECFDALKKKHPDIQMVEFSEEQEKLIQLVQSKQDAFQSQPTPIKQHNLLYQLGKETIFKLKQIDGLIILVGDLTNKIFLSLMHWKRFQIPSIISNMSSTGIQALPILALLSFLIGVVLAYQMGLQLETYGASNFIAYLSGMAIFREFSPLITAIIVAGRTSSAFTAQIGSMKINEEIDALHVMGLSPTELLVVPKIIGLMIMFPLIIFWSDMFSLLGAMIMSKFMLSVSYYEFITRIQITVGFKQMMLGLYKAPAFALLIALVGCHQGFLVGSSADSVGKQTTKSVVQALFLIIITDATYSIIYSWLNL